MTRLGFEAWDDSWEQNLDPSRGEGSSIRTTAEVVSGTMVKTLKHKPGKVGSPGPKQLV